MYITDCLKILVGGEIPRYNDLIKRSYNGDKETESAEQIISRLSEGLDKLGGESGGDTIRNDD